MSIANTSRYRNATKSQNNTAQNHTNKSVTRYPLKFLTRNRIKAVICPKNHIIQMNTTVREHYL
jgi:hypothetical protein